MAKRTLAYLSGAPRVSTDPYAELGGTRAHVLGVIAAFKDLGWEVKSFILGDHVPRTWVYPPQSDTHLPRGLRLIAADLIRLTIRLVAPYATFWITGSTPEWIYERYAAFQALGRIFQRRGALWILETNAPVFYEALVERDGTALPRLAKHLEARAYHQCDILICVSDALKQIIMREFGIPAQKIVVLPNAVNPILYDPSLYHPRRLFNEFTVGFVGTLYGWQGVDSLLEAVSELRQEGLNICTVIVGDGPARAALEAQMRQLGLNPYVRFVGQVPQDQVPAYILGMEIGYSGQKTMHIGAMYHSPLKLYEYMAMGRPVIAADFADARTLIEGNGTGFLFPDGDLPGLKDAIRKAFVAHSRLAIMGASARSLILAHHTWEKRINDLIRLIDTTRLEDHF